MINVAGIWLALAAILVGWGLAVVAVLRRFAGASGGALSAFQTLWLGYAGLLAALQLASLVVPVNTGVLVASVAPAVAGYVARWPDVAGRVRTLVQRPRELAVLCGVVVATAVLVDYYACDAVQWYDTGLYHLQAVKWNARYGAVIGLANLHTRLGYNNSVHVFAAYVDAAWEGMAAHVTDGFIVLVALAQWFTEMFRARTPRQRVRQAFCLVTLPYLLATLATIQPSSLSTDLPEAVFSAVLVLELASALFETGTRAVLPLAAIAAIGAVALTTKLTGLAVCGVAVAVTGWRLRGASWRLRRAVGVVPAALVLGWLARGVMQSGWLLYPVAGRLPVSWAVPRSVAADDLGNIRSWSRMWAKPPSEVFGHGFWHWFGPWFETFRKSQALVLLLCAVAFVAWRAAAGPMRSGARALAERSAVAACALGIVQWFAGAPDLRYGDYLFWLLLGAASASALAPALREPKLRGLALGLALGLCVWSGGFALREDSTLPKLWGRLIAPPHGSPRRVTTENGLDVITPKRGTDQCFDADLPCTPMPNNARPRDHEDLGAGFVPAHSD